MICPNLTDNVKCTRQLPNRIAIESREQQIKAAMTTQIQQSMCACVCVQVSSSKIDNVLGTDCHYLRSAPTRVLAIYGLPIDLSD